MLIIRHLTKSRSDKPIYQGVGSIDVIGAARSAILVAKHPEDPNLKVIAHVKHNLSEKGMSWQFALIKEEGQKVPILKWLGPTDISAEDLLSTPDHDSKSARDDAIDFLREYLQEDPRRADAVLAAAEARSISSRTLDRAKVKIGVDARKRGTRWYWSLRKIKVAADH